MFSSSSMFSFVRIHSRITESLTGTWLKLRVVWHRASMNTTAVTQQVADARPPLNQVSSSWILQGKLGVLSPVSWCNGFFFSLCDRCFSLEAKPFWIPVWRLRWWHAEGILINFVPVIAKKFESWLHLDWHSFSLAAEIWRWHHHREGVPQNLQHRLCHPQSSAKHSTRQSKCTFKYEHLSISKRESCPTRRLCFCFCSWPTPSVRRWIYWKTDISVDQNSWCMRKTSLVSQRRWTGMCQDCWKKFPPDIFCHSWHSFFFPHAHFICTLFLESYIKPSVLLHSFQPLCTCFSSSFSC